MANKKRKFEARFPPARIKKIMQTDEDIGKVAAAVPLLLSKALEIFIQSLVTKASQQATSKHLKTLTTAHLKRCIESEPKFDFLKDVVSSVSDIPNKDEEQDLSCDADPKAKRRKVTPRKPRGSGSQSERGSKDRATSVSEGGKQRTSDNGKSGGSTGSSVESEPKSSSLPSSLSAPKHGPAAIATPPLLGFPWKPEDVEGDDYDED